MQIISGRYIGQPHTVHYEALPAAEMPAAMQRFLDCLATAINADHNAYYHSLEKVGKSEINLHGFLDYSTGAVNRAQAIAKADVAFVVNKTRFYDRHG